MSIFVNPTQFGPSEDFAAYPRTLDDDEALIAAAGNVDLLFVPDAAEIYPFGLEHAVRVQLPPLSRELCGASRPGHFDGVATVVCRLLNIVAPDVLFLGQKDYQQLVLIERMIADLRMPVELRMGPTAREPDGLAMSSRNRYLDAAERRQAPGAARGRWRECATRLRGGARDFSRLERPTRARSSSARGSSPTTWRCGAPGGSRAAARGERSEERVVLGAASARPSAPHRQSIRLTSTATATRLRPASFASYIAASARCTSVADVVVGGAVARCRSRSVMAVDRLGGDKPGDLLPQSLAPSAAPASSCTSGSSTANSSPPKRATRSVGRRYSRSASATAIEHAVAGDVAVLVVEAS